MNGVLVDEGDGAPLVLMGGFDEGTRARAELMPALRERFRVIVPASTEPSDVRATLERLGLERVAIVAVSDGAVPALRFGLEDDALDALVLVSPLGTRDLVAEEDRLAAWDLPVLMFGGEDDPTVSVRELERLNEALPSSTLGLVPDAGHDLLEETPETIGPMILEYLRARYLRAPHGHADASGVVLLQLERRAAAGFEWDEDDDEPATPDPGEQEVGPRA